MSIAGSIHFRGGACDDRETLERLPGALRAWIEPDGGFVCLDGALHVRGPCRTPHWHALRSAWDAREGVHARHPVLQPDDIPFAQTSFGDQLLLRGHEVWRLEAESGALEPLGVSLGRFVQRIERGPGALLHLDAAERPASGWSDAERLLGSWFDGAERAPERIPAALARWFAGDEAFDAFLHAQFGEWLEHAEAHGPPAAWQATPRSRVAAVLLLDQLPRNLRRRSPRAFAQDARARALCLRALEDGVDQRVPALFAAFLYLPLEHSEALEDQQLCVALFEALVDRAPEPARGVFEGFAEYARRHREVIARFGRFPHRNAVLGRPTSEQERAWLVARPDGF